MFFNIFCSIFPLICLLSEVPVCHTLRMGLKLEINEWLYITAFNLHNHKDDECDGDGGQSDTTFCENLDNFVLPTVGYPMGDEGKEHKRKDVLIGDEDFGKNCRVEFCQHLSKHDPCAFKSCVSEQQPCQTNNMECDEDGYEASPSVGVIVPVMM